MFLSDKVAIANLFFNWNNKVSKLHREEIKLLSIYLFSSAYFSSSLRTNIGIFEIIF